MSFLIGFFIFPYEFQNTITTIINAAMAPVKVPNVPPAAPYAGPADSPSFDILLIDTP